jgi:hypothetical protein
VVVVEADVVGGFDAGVDWTVAGKGEPEFDLVGDGGACFVSVDVGFDVDGAFIAFGVDFEGEELIVDEVVDEERVVLLGEVGPGIDFDALGFWHWDLN